MVAMQEYSNRQVNLFSSRSVAIGRGHNGLQNQRTAKEVLSFPSVLSFVMLWPDYCLYSNLPVDELAHTSVLTAATAAAAGFAWATAATEGYIFSPARQSLQEQ